MTAAFRGQARRPSRTVEEIFALGLLSWKYTRPSTTLDWILALHGANGITTQHRAFKAGFAFARRPSCSTTAT